MALEAQLGLTTDDLGALFTEDVVGWSRYASVSGLDGLRELSAFHEIAFSTQTVHFTWAFQARPLYERAGYELVGRVADFPSGTDVLWYRKPLKRSAVAPGDEGPGPSGA